MMELYAFCGIALCLWYVMVVIWMLRQEKLWHRYLLIALMVLTFGHRLFGAVQSPIPPHPDEVGDVVAAAEAVNAGTNPVLPGPGLRPLAFVAIMAAPLTTILTPVWALRIWPLLCSGLLPLGAFAVVRALGHGVLAGCLAALSMVFLPWAIAYSQTSIGGTHTFWHEAIVLWAIALLMAPRLTVPLPFVIISGALAGGLLMYESFAARMIIWIVPACLVIVRPRHWVPLLCIAGGIWLLYLPVWYWAETPWTWIVIFPPPQTLAVVHSASELLGRLWQACTAFFSADVPGGGSLNVPRVTNLPALFAAAAVFGWIGASWREKWLLLVVFGLGILPAAGATAEGGLNLHRAVLAFIVPVLGAAIFFDEYLMRCRA